MNRPNQQNMSSPEAFDDEYEAGQGEEDVYESGSEESETLSLNYLSEEEGEETIQPCPLIPVEHQPYNGGNYETGNEGNLIPVEQQHYEANDATLIPVEQPAYYDNMVPDGHYETDGGALIQVDGDDESYLVPAATAPAETEPVAYENPFHDIQTSENPEYVSKPLRLDAYAHDDDDYQEEYEEEYETEDIHWPGREDPEQDFSESYIVDDGRYMEPDDEDDERNVVSGIFLDRPEMEDHFDDDEREERKAKPKDMYRRRRRRRKCCWLLCCCLCLLLLLLLGWGLYMLLKDDDEEEPEVEEDDYIPPDDDFVVNSPYEGVTTTPLDPFEDGDCYFGDNIFPHTLQQCDCFETISIIPNDTVALYNEIRGDIDNEFYNNTYNEPMNSCDPANQALIWLSSGNTRDSGDLFQRYALAMTYFTTNGTNWDIQHLWLSDESECIWFSIQCNGRFRVNSMALDAMNLHGSLPTEMAKLAGLRVIALSRNHMSGTIPSEIIMLPNLQRLLLNDNQLHGNIPTEIGLATKLKDFQIVGNLHFGIIPSEIGQATALEELGIGFNDFWRRIPTHMGLLSNMRSLNMEDNRLSGGLPTEFAMMTNLEYFLISKNLLKGPLPIEYASMTNLQEFKAAHTGIGGVLSTEFGVLTSLYRLELGGNNFRGTIMTEFGLMTGLNWLSMADNDLTGPIPTELGNLVNMTRLQFTDCMLTGEIPSELGRMTILENLAVDKNDIVGRAPKEVCDLRLRELNLFVTDCPSRGNVGVVCPIPDCCSFCRRGDNSG